MAKTKDYIVIASLFLVFSIAYAFLFIAKHDWQFQTFGLDSGFFHQVLWLASRGNFGQSTIYNHSIMSSNFEPILFLLAPLIKVWPDVRLLFIIQATVAVSAVIPLYLLAKKISGSLAFSAAIILAYSLLVPFQHAILDGFTQSFFVAPILAWAYYFLATNNRMYWCSVLGLIATKEEFSLFLVPFGISVAIFYRQWRTGLVTAITGVVVFWFLIYLLNPIVSPGVRNWAHYDQGYGAGGANPESVVKNILGKPVDYAVMLVNDVQKRETIFLHQASFGFLQLLSPALLLPVAYEYFVRFINTDQIVKWRAHDFNFGVVLVVSAIYGARQLARKVNYRYLALFLVISTFLAYFVYHGPINSLLKRDFYYQPQWAKDNQAIIKLVPPDMPISANNSLVPHLSDRQKIYLWPNVADAKYIILDLRDHPNAFAPVSFEKSKELVDKLLTEKSFKIKAKIGQAMILERL